MSERLHRFVQALYARNGSRILFQSGTPVRMEVGGQEIVLLDTQVRTEQIQKLLLPAFPPNQPPSTFLVGSHQFEYSSPSGPVRIEISGDGDTVAASIVPHGREAAPQPPKRQVSSAGPSIPTPAEGIDEMLAGFVVQGSGGGRAAPSGAPPTRQNGRSPEASAPPSALPQPEPAPPPVVIAVPEPPTVVAKHGIDHVLLALVKNKGSDLHLTTGQKPKIRLDGDIRDLPGFNDPLTSEQIESWMTEVAHDTARGQFREANDADFAYEIENISRFRMNWFRDRNGVGAVMRTIPSNVLTAEQLGLSKAILDLCALPKGLVVVTGPTGSGKSTTLAAMVDHINKTRRDHIITVEDPVEFVHKSQSCLVNQREVHTHTESFSAALRAALREDPDIVLVGEMRDLETVHIAIETAATGHLVFGTLHTNTAASTIDRIIDQFPTDQQSQIRVMLSESLRGVVAQTLCKKIGGGRAACMEILIANAAVCNLVREAKTFQIPSIMQTGKGLGMQTQQDHMLQLVQNKIVAPEEAVLKAVDGASMKAALERAGYS